MRPERSRSFAVASVRARSLSIAEAGVLESAASQASSRKAPIASRKMSMMHQRPGDDKLSTSMPSRRASRVIDADGSYRRKSISSMKEESPAAPLDLTFTDDYNTSETSALQEVYQYRKANSTPSPTKTTKSAISNKRRRSLVAAGAC